MHRLLRDTIVAVVGGVVVSLIVTFTTSLTKGQLDLAWAAALATCGLTLAALQLPRLVRRQREKFEAEVIAAARSAVLSALAVQISEPGEFVAPAAVAIAAKASSRADEIVELRTLLGEGDCFRPGCMAG